MNLGLDLGMGACKIYGPSGGIQMPSHVSIADGRIIGHLAGMKSTTPPTKITVDGRAFYIGAGAHDWGRPVENLDYDRLTGAPEMRAIFYATFAELMRYAAQDWAMYSEPLSLWVGMPLEPLTGEAERVKATVAAVRAWLRGQHEFIVSNEFVTDVPMTINVADVRVTSQPTGALFDYLLDDDGRFRPDRKAHAREEIGIVSVGFNTVELLVVQDTQIVNRFTAGTTAGVRRLLDLVNGDDLYSLGELDGRLRSSSLDVRDALPVWSREVNGAIERTWSRSWRRFARIIVVGGGALLLNGELTFAGKAYVPDEPVMAIARGLYKMARKQEAKR